MFYKILPSKYKDSKHQTSALSRSENRAKDAVRQMLAEEYQLEKLQSYPKDYLIEIIK